MPIKDPQKRRAYQRNYMRAWYKKNAHTQIQRNYAWRQSIQARFAQLKTTLRCARCGENHPACLDFHHDDSAVKETTVNEALWRKNWGLARLLAEAAKCTVLCSNCHRKLHWDTKLC